MEPAAFGKYQVVAKIGEGGFGEVYRGRDPNLKRRVAIKTCKSANPALLERFVREAEIAARLQHPNIVTVFDFGYQDQTPYLVQEYLSGEDLDRKIRRRQAIDPAARIDWLRQVALGLRHAHLQGVIHRDVKPANVRVLDGGLVKIMDFGIAKLLTAEVELTRTGVTLGSARYLPPEQFHGDKIDLRADVFSFGVTAYELLTWECPFDGDSVARIFYRITHEEPRPIAELWPECPPRLALCVATCLQKDPAQRYSDLAPVIAELEGYLGVSAALSEPFAAVPEPPSTAPPPPPPLAATTPLPADSGSSELSSSFLGRSYSLVLGRPRLARAALFVLVAVGAFALTYLLGRFLQGGSPPVTDVAVLGASAPSAADPEAPSTAVEEPAALADEAAAVPAPTPSAKPPPAELPSPVTVESTTFEPVADDGRPPPAVEKAPPEEALESSRPVAGPSAEPAPDEESVGEPAAAVPATVEPPDSAPGPAPVEPQVRHGITLFRDRDFEGPSETFFADDRDLRDNDIGNDTVTSVRVDPGCRVSLYQHIDYGGKVTVLTSDSRRLRGTEVGNNEVSSIQVICRRNG